MRSALRMWRLRIGAWLLEPYTDALWCKAMSGAAEARQDGKVDLELASLYKADGINEASWPSASRVAALWGKR